MTDILRIAFTLLLAGAVAIAPASAGVPVVPVVQTDLPASADESMADPFDRSPRSSAARRPATPAGRLPQPTGPATRSVARPPAGPFYLSVAPHVRFCVWRE
ncbi:MAG: hypothetical protein MUF18_01255 [Fimbriiglobus sp.]|nr:hypothetical protein [Fimbriiglobus sp.]